MSFVLCCKPVIERDGMLLMVDDENERGEIRTRLVRFRTLGCYPLTGAIDSSATSLLRSFWSYCK